MRSHNAVIGSSVHATEQAIHQLSLKLRRIELSAADLLKKEGLMSLAVISFALAMFGVLVLWFLQVLENAPYSSLRFSFPAFNPYQPPPPVVPFFF